MTKPNLIKSLLNTRPFEFYMAHKMNRPLGTGQSGEFKAFCLSIVVQCGLQFSLDSPGELLTSLHGVH